MYRYLVLSFDKDLSEDNITLTHFRNTELYHEDSDISVTLRSVDCGFMDRLFKKKYTPQDFSTMTGAILKTLMDKSKVVKHDFEIITEVKFDLDQLGALVKIEDSREIINQTNERSEGKFVW